MKFKGWGIFLVLLAGCSSMEFVSIDSDPNGATVFLGKGKELGVTPLKISSQEINEASPDGSLDLVIKKERHETREIHITPDGVERYNVRLTPYDNNYFQRVVKSSYRTEMNSLLRRILSIQGLLLANEVAATSRELDEFEKEFPSLGVTFVLRAGLAQLQGDLIKARQMLEMAQKLDPDDPVASRGLSSLKSSKNLGGSR
jgi:hypothetical protein